MTRSPHPLRVFLVCTGVGIMNRGLETFARNCFDHLQDLDGLDLHLFKGAGEDSEREHCLWTIPRTSPLAERIGRGIRRNGYVVEQLSSVLPLVPWIRRLRPQVIFYSDSNLGFQLYYWRKWIGVPYHLLFSNGAPIGPNFPRTDFVHQVTPYFRDLALGAGEPQQRQFMVPYGIDVPLGEPSYDPHQRQERRKKLHLPGDRPIVLSVGAIDPQSHKRMDYLINEIAQLPEPRPFLVLLGHMPPGSEIHIQQAQEQLGETGFTARSVPSDQVLDYYQAADLFALASLQEGFGRVYLEALSQGLPCFVHDHPVMRYVLGDQGYYGDFSQPGAIAQQLPELLRQPLSPETMAQRRQSIRDRFSWPVLGPKYLEMFQACCQLNS
ncbi:glycosyltransferase family 4 protein [Candidatus Synechococcus calcipolaris G9]|uniref:Glycosyltransferase family 4 protein n=1 Tax=Candidatus Synechococcus calcipolaris G9 TaxID=1497997 RepID=A0ABT6EW28_9SYNE|nr:glycosyltransferase family 4 protein [Candidatus Synechococcus calcipolaris]MDG2989587.1 glycosyltransferase family 4 protein [Candidatus Synechococcus calcipolaris G9]